MRLNKKTITAKGIEWVLSETVLVTFEGSTYQNTSKFLGKSPPPKENSNSEITLNNRDFVHLKKLSLNQEFKLKCIDHARTDLKPNPQWPTPKTLTNIKNYNTIKNSTKKEEPLPNQPIYIKLTS
ncbi:hypothetical protein K0M31_006784 [Melipona bicolor]|uniref:Uncharacterized protein n=1 Tax=Melipona bicolor TaxID=60889 RepID=A0AA40KL52_9HYME|nr:hypothetical protein K0M31_006784 [Melipona bicolor]